MSILGRDQLSQYWGEARDMHIEEDPFISKVGRDHLYQKWEGTSYLNSGEGEGEVKIGACINLIVFTIAPMLVGP